MGVQINGDTGNISATKADYSGNVTIGGTLTYEDVTNVDSIGIVTARNGIEVGARPGVAASISVDGNMIVSGVSTFNGAVTIDDGLNVGGNLSIPDKIIHAGDTNTAIRFSDADTVSVETSGSERLRIDSSGSVGINESTPDSKVDILYASSTDTATQKLIHLRTDPSGSYATRGLFIKIGRDGNYDNSSAHYDIVGSSGNSGTHIFEVEGSTVLSIDKTGYVTKPKNLCLSYTASSSLNYTSSGTLIYATEVFDVGDSNAYNTSTGVFTAPVTGIYNIYHEYYNVTGYNAMTKLEKSTNSGSSFSQIKIFGRQRNDDAYTSAGFSHLVQANANDQFKITWYDGQVHINNTFTHFHVQLVQ